MDKMQVAQDSTSAEKSSASLDKAPVSAWHHSQMDSRNNDKSNSASDNNKSHKKEGKRTSSLPPPHPVPPPPQDDEDISKLLSPWWSEEPPSDRPPKKKGIYNIVSFSRTGTADGMANGPVTDRKKATWKENCLLLTRRETKPRSDALKHQFGGECSMVCFFREGKEIRKRKLKELGLSNTWNPFYGNWVVFASSRARCLEHIEAKEMTRKDMPDYCVVDLGEYFGQAGEDAKRIIKRTFMPVQELTNQYMDSWRNGSQNAFFARFLESARRGDAFLLIRDGTKRMIESALRFTKKDDDHSDRKK